MKHGSLAISFGLALATNLLLTTPGVFARTLWTTFRFTFTVMVFCLLIGYPIAFFLAMQVKSFKWQLALFLLAMVPFWTSYLIRAVAWLPMLSSGGSSARQAAPGPGP